MRVWRNRQTRTFEGRVVIPYGFKSHHSHQEKDKHFVFILFFFMVLQARGLEPVRVSAFRKCACGTFLAESARRVLKFVRISVAEAGSLQGASHRRRSSPITRTKKRINTLCLSFSFLQGGTKSRYSRVLPFCIYCYEVILCVRTNWHSPLRRLPPRLRKIKPPQNFLCSPLFSRSWAIHLPRLPYKPKSATKHRKVRFTVLSISY